MRKKITISPEKRRWLRAEEAAEILDLHPKSVYRLISKKKIPFKRFGGAVRVDRLALEGPDPLAKGARQ